MYHAAIARKCVFTTSVFTTSVFTTTSDVPRRYRTALVVAKNGRISEKNIALVCLPLSAFFTGSLENFCRGACVGRGMHNFLESCVSRVCIGYIYWGTDL